MALQDISNVRTGGEPAFDGFGSQQPRKTFSRRGKQLDDKPEVDHSRISASSYQPETKVTQRRGRPTLKPQQLSVPPIPEYLAKYFQEVDDEPLNIEYSDLVTSPVAVADTAEGGILASAAGAKCGSHSADYASPTHCTAAGTLSFDLTSEITPPDHTTNARSTASDTEGTIDLTTPSSSRKAAEPCSSERHQTGDKCLETSTQVAGLCLPAYYPNAEPEEQASAQLVKSSVKIQGTFSCSHEAPPNAYLYSSAARHLEDSTQSMSQELNTDSDEQSMHASFDGCSSPAVASSEVDCDTGSDEDSLQASLDGYATDDSSEMAAAAGPAAVDCDTSCFSSRRTGTKQNIESISPKQHGQRTVFKLTATTVTGSFDAERSPSIWDNARSPPVAYNPECQLPADGLVIEDQSSADSDTFDFLARLDLAEKLPEAASEDVAQATQSTGAADSACNSPVVAQQALSPLELLRSPALLSQQPLSPSAQSRSSRSPSQTQGSLSIMLLASPASSPAPTRQSTPGRASISSTSNEAVDSAAFGDEILGVEADALDEQLFSSGKLETALSSVHTIAALASASTLLLPQINEALPARRPQLPPASCEPAQSSKKEPAAVQIKGTKSRGGSARGRKKMTGLEKLLAVCGQEADAASVETMDELMDRLGFREAVKLGEGTYAEVFKLGSSVLKIMPVDGRKHINGFLPRRSEDVAAEVQVQLLLSNLRQGGHHCTSAFVEMGGVWVVKGPYSEMCVSAWDDWANNADNETFNQHVASISHDQLYVVMAMEDCGNALEDFPLESLAQGLSMLLQVVMALAVAEQALQFEHRDLHWGNVMLRATNKPVVFICGGSRMTVTDHQGLEAVLIDCTLSRMVGPEGEVLFFDLSKPKEKGIFESQANEDNLPCDAEQFETYRMMKAANGNDWHQFLPSTNCMWVHYLAGLLITSKELPKKGLSREEMKSEAAICKALRQFRKRSLGYSSCYEMLMEDELFAGRWSVMDDDAAGLSQGMANLAL